MLCAPEPPSLQRLGTKCRSGSASWRLPNFAARDRHAFVQERSADSLSRREEENNVISTVLLENNTPWVGGERQGGGVGKRVTGIIEDEHYLLFRKVIVPAPRLHRRVRLLDLPRNGCQVLQAMAGRRRHKGPLALTAMVPHDER